MSTGTPADRPASPDDPAPAVEPSDDPMDRPMGLGIDFSDPHSRLAPYYLRATGVLVAFALGLIFALYSNLPLQYSDVWVHLKLGRWIVEHRQVPTDEPLHNPYTDATRFTNLPWLTQAAYHLTFTAGQSLAGGDAGQRFVGGGDLLRQLHAVAGVAYLAFLALAFRRASGSGALQLLGLAVAFAAALLTVGLHRPQTFGLVGYAALLAALSRPVLSRRATVAVPLLLVLWANLHGSFVIGFGLLGVAWLGRVIEASRSVPTGRLRNVVVDPQVRRLTVVLVAGLVAVGLANPFGHRLYLLAAGFGGNPNLKYLLEWQPIDFQARSPEWVLYAASVVGLTVTQAVSPRPFSPFQMLLLLTFGVAPLVQQRMLTWWLPLAVWIAVTHLAAAAAEWGVALPQTVPSFRKTLLAALVFGMCLMLVPTVQRFVTGKPPKADAVFVPATPLDLVGVIADPSAPTTERMMPVANALTERAALPVLAVAGAPVRMEPLTKALAERYAGRPVGPLFTTAEIGELLYWRDIPGSPPLLFTHAHLFPERHWAECFAVRAGAGGWWEPLDRDRVNLIAVEAEFCPQLVKRVRERGDEWEVAVDQGGDPAVRDPRARLFVAIRRTPK